MLASVATTLVITSNIVNRPKSELSQTLEANTTTELISPTPQNLPELKLQPLIQPQEKENTSIPPKNEPETLTAKPTERTTPKEQSQPSNDTNPQDHQTSNLVSTDSITPPSLNTPHQKPSQTESEIRDLSTRIALIEQNLNTIFENQKELNVAINDSRTNIDKNHAINQKNQTSIAEILKYLLKDQVSTLSNKSALSAGKTNPLNGTDSLPSVSTIPISQSTKATYPTSNSTSPMEPDLPQSEPAAKKALPLIPE